MCDSGAAVRGAVPVFDAAGDGQVTAEGWWVWCRGRPLESVVNTVCRLGLTPPPPAPWSLPTLGSPPTSQTGTDDRATKSHVFIRALSLWVFLLCTNTFCFRLTIAEPFPACNRQKLVTHPSLSPTHLSYLIRTTSPAQNPYPWV